MKNFDLHPFDNVQRENIYKHFAVRKRIRILLRPAGSDPRVGDGLA